MKQLFCTVVVAVAIGANAQINPIDSDALEQVQVSSGPSDQTQPIKVFEGKTLFFEVSQSELNRLVVYGTGIKSIGYVQSDIDIIRDEANNQAYLAPKVANKVISLFVTTKNGTTFTLNIEPKPGLLGKSIRLYENENAQAQKKPQSPQTVPKPNALSLTWQQEIIELIYGAANPRVRSQMDFKAINQQFSLWEGTYFVQQGVLQSNSGLSVEIFSLTNIGTEAMRLLEAEFYTDDVVAVALQEHKLQPSQTTPVYIVKLSAE